MDKDQVFILVHVSLGQDLPHTLIEVAQLFDHGGTYEFSKENLACRFVEVLRLAVLGSLAYREASTFQEPHR